MALPGHEIMGFLGFGQGEDPLHHRPDRGAEQGPDLAQQGIADGAFLVGGAATQGGGGQGQPLGQNGGEIDLGPGAVLIGDIDDAAPRRDRKSNV